MMMKTEVKKKKNVRLSQEGRKRRKKSKQREPANTERGSERVSVCPLDSTDREREGERGEGAPPPPVPLGCTMGEQAFGRQKERDGQCF